MCVCVTQRARCLARGSGPLFLISKGIDKRKSNAPFSISFPLGRGRVPHALICLRGNSGAATGFARCSPDAESEVS